MALTKEIKTDKIEVLGDHKHVQCREATVISEDGVELSRSFHRHVLEPSRYVANGAENSDGEWVNDGTFSHIDTDISGEPQETQDVCNAVWTDEVKAAWETWCEANPPII
jgi:hypothetical protein